MPEPSEKPPFHVLFDDQLQKLKDFTPVEKQALRGAVLEILFKHEYYVNKQKPESDVLFDIRNQLLCELLHVISLDHELDLDQISHYIRAYNSKVGDNFKLNMDIIWGVFENLANRFTGLKSVN